MDENGDIRASLADALAKVEILQSANHIGLPFERQMEAKLYLLRHQIAEYQSILECSNLPLIAFAGVVEFICAFSWLAAAT